jgi:hypothetical protein
MLLDLMVNKKSLYYGCYVESLGAEKSENAISVCFETPFGRAGNVNTRFER